MGEVSMLSTLPLFLSILVAVAGATTLIRKFRGCTCEPSSSLAVPARTRLSKASDALSAAYNTAKRAELAEKHARIWSTFDTEFYHAVLESSHSNEQHNNYIIPLASLASRFKIPVSHVKLYLGGLCDAGKLEGTIDQYGGCFILEKKNISPLQVPKEDAVQSLSYSSISSSSADDSIIQAFTNSLPGVTTLKKSKSYGTFQNITSVVVN